MLASRCPSLMGKVGEPELCPFHTLMQRHQGENFPQGPLGKGLVSGKTEWSNEIPFPWWDLFNW